MGLMKAVEKRVSPRLQVFDLRTWWIWQAITRSIADQARRSAPVHMITINVHACRNSSCRIRPRAHAGGSSRRTAPVERARCKQNGAAADPAPVAGASDDTSWRFIEDKGGEPLRHDGDALEGEDHDVLRCH